MADEPPIRRFRGALGGRTLVRLVVASVIVGAFLAFWDVSPLQFWSGAFDFFKGVAGWLGDSVGEVVVNLFKYFLFGAAIVLPIWAVTRALGSSDRRR